jgi:hypothetical protein
MRPDDKHWAFAGEQGRVIVTQDADFLRMASAVKETPRNCLLPLPGTFHRTGNPSFASNLGGLRARGNAQSRGVHLAAATQDSPASFI